MGISTNFNAGDFRKNYEQALIDLITGIKDAFELAGLNAVAYARDKKPEGVKDFTDRTNNLRSSIGYVLYKDGEKISSNFAAAGSGKDGNGTEGVESGLKHAEQVASNYSNGFVLVLAAGMHYAAYVEAKGYDVLSGAGLEGKNELENSFSNLISLIKEKTNIDFKIIKK